MKDFANIPGLALRELAPSDIAAFIEMGLPTCAFMHGRTHLSPEKMRHNFTGFVREYAFDADSEIFVVVNGDGAHLAQIWLHTTRNRFNGYGEQWVWDLTVREDFRRRGVGRALLAFARSRAVEKNCSELWLLVSSINDEAIRLYESFGMRPAGHLMRLGLDGASHDLEPMAISTNSIVLRPLEPRDVPALYHLWTTAGLAFRPQGRDREDRLARHLAGSGVHGWGAIEGGQLVAATLISSDGRKGWIERLATLPDYRRAGLAKALVTAATNSLKQSGVLVIAALIESQNLASCKLFESCGFVHNPGLRHYSMRDNPGS